MSADDASSIPRLERLHAAIFSAGTIATLVGLIVSSPPLLMTAGACFIVTGLLILVGSRITMRGPLGDTLRVALGRRRVFTMHLRGVLWVMLGLALIVLSIQALRDGTAIPLNPWIADLT